MKKKATPKQKTDYRADWKDEVDTEIIELKDDIDNAFEGLEIDKSVIEMVQKAVKDFQERTNKAIDNFTISKEMVFDTDDLLDDCLWEMEIGNKKASDTEKERMIEITKGNGEYVHVESLAEQIRLEDFLTTLRDNPYQLKLIA